MKVVVIGAGLAGLTCARRLLHAGLDVRILEASDGVGGRVRSDRTDDGFLLDRGFQVLFTAYSAARRNLDYDALDLRAFEPGAVICRGAWRSVLADPIRDGARSLLPTLLTNVVTLEDKIRTGLLGVEVVGRTDEYLLEQLRDGTTETFARVRRGFSERYLDNFLRPFFGGIFLSRDLQTTCRLFTYYWKMLATGDTVLPARGMGLIPKQLAAELVEAGRIRLRCRVVQLVQNGGARGRVLAAIDAGGNIHSADIFIVATDAPTAHELTGVAAPRGYVSSTTVYFAGDAPLWDDKKIRLHSNARPFVNSATLVSNVAPDYAPPGQSLLSLTVLGEPQADLPDEALFARSRADFTRMLAGDKAALSTFQGYRPLRIYRVRYAQFAQPPGTFDALPDATGRLPGTTSTFDDGDDVANRNLLYAAEWTQNSSIQGAMTSGEKAADRVLAQFGVR